MSTLRILLNNRQVDVQLSPAVLPNYRPHRALGAERQPSSRNGGRDFLLAKRECVTRSVLTPRETQVLKLVAAGLSNKQTAAEMNVSIKTVQKHRQSVMDKVKLHDTASLTRYAITRGILLDNQFRRDLSHQWYVNSGITVRENQVLKLVAEGLVNKQIASELNISIKTVGNHRQGLMNRLNIHEVAGLTRFAISQGLLPLGMPLSALVGQARVLPLSPTL